MNAVKRTPIWAIVLMAVLGGNLSLMVCLLYVANDIRSSSGHLKLQTLTTNDLPSWPFVSGQVSAMGVVDTKTGHPVWARWNVDPDGNKTVESYLFQGRKAFDVYWTNGRPAVYNVYFYGPHESVTWWQNRAGADEFTQRTFYDTNGVLSRSEAWVDSAWRQIVKRDEARGILIGGQWHRLELGAGGHWAVDGQPGSSSKP